MAKSIDEVAKALGLDQKSKDQREEHVWGVVASINSDGSYQVKLNSSTVTTRCAKCVDAKVGDRLLVLKMRNGSTVAIAKLL